MIGNKLKSLRETHNLSQAELAKKLNISQQALSKWENNHSEPDIISLKAISNFFNISLDTLLNNKYNSKINNQIKEKEIIRQILIKYNIIDTNTILNDQMIDTIFNFIKINKDILLKKSK